MGGGSRGCSAKSILESGPPWYECCGESFLSSQPQFPLPRWGLMIADRSVMRVTDTPHVLLVICSA